MSLLNNDGELTISKLQKMLKGLPTSGKAEPFFMDNFPTISTVLTPADEPSKNKTKMPKDIVDELMAAAAILPGVYTAGSVGLTGPITSQTRSPKTDTHTYQDEDGRIKMRVDYPIDRTLIELITVLNAHVNVHDVQIVYDMEPDEVSIVISHKEKTTQTQWQIVEEIARIINNTALTDYDQLEWTIRAKGVKKFDRNLQGSTGRDESQLQQPLGQERRTSVDPRYTERYGIGILGPSAIARASTLSTD